MKRMWIGAGLLAVLLAVGLLVGTAMGARLSPGADKLRQAGEFALAGDWEKAEMLTDSVRADWERTRWLVEILTSHENLEQIDMSFAQLSVYGAVDGPAYSALCTALAQQLEALGKAHGCSWENFF